LFRKCSDRRKQLVAEMEQFVLGCFFGLGFDLFAG
jgi:hypothetical protein